MSFFAWKLVAVSFLFLIQSALAEESRKVDLSRAQAAFEREIGTSLRAGYRVEPTVFPGYYAVRPGSSSGRGSAYFREDMLWMGNVKTPGWVSRSTIENSPEGRVRWLKEQVKHLPLDRLILIQRSQPIVAVIWSAPDCHFCRKLEDALEQEGVSAYVAPVGLSKEGYQRSAEVYCNKDPSKAWTAIMHGNRLDSPSVPSCSYPRDMLDDIGFFFGQGRLVTPIVVFADGSTVSGWDDLRGRARLREKISKQIFFPPPKSSDVK